MTRTCRLQCRLGLAGYYRTHAIDDTNIIDLTLRSSWKAIDGEAQGLKSRNRVRRMLNSDDDAEKINGFIQKLSWSIQSFMVRIVLSVGSDLELLTRCIN